MKKQVSGASATVQDAERQVEVAQKAVQDIEGAMKGVELKKENKLVRNLMQQALVSKKAYWALRKHRWTIRKYHWTIRAQF